LILGSGIEVMSHPEDKELLEMFRQEQSSHYAFNLIVRKYQQRLYHHIKRMVTDHEDANDVLQNTFIKVWKGLHSFREDSQLYTWLYRIASNESITFINKRKKRKATSIEEVHEISELSNSGSVSPHPDQMEMKIQKAIDALPEQQKMVFSLRYFDEMKYEDMSEVLNVSVGALKASYHHAVKKVEKIILGH